MYIQLKRLISFRKRPVRQFLFACALALFSTHTPALAQNNYAFQNYTIRNGLSQSTITTLVQDQVGFLWVGTQNGLNRFDGKQIVNFNKHNTPGIDSEYFLSSIKLKDGQILYGTNEGILHYDAVKDQFKSYYLPHGKAVQVEHIVEISDELILFSSSQMGLYAISRNKKDQTFQMREYANTIPSKRIHALQVLSENLLLVSTEDKGVFSYNLSSKKWTKIDLGSDRIKINKALKVEANRWVMATTQGVYELDITTLQVRNKFSEVSLNLKTTEVNDIYFDGLKTFYLATSQQGLIALVEVKADKYQVFQHNNDYFNDNSLISNTITTIYQAVDKSFFLGSDRGFGNFNPYINNFYGYSLNSNPRKGLTTPNVWCFTEDLSDQSIYIGTDDELSRFNRKESTFEHLLKDALSKHTELTGASLLSICSIAPQELLVGTSKGLIRFHTKSKKISVIGTSKTGISSSLERVYGIVHWKESLYFLACRSGAVILNLENNSLQEFIHDPQNPSSTILEGVCRVVYKDKWGDIWFATSGGGLNKLMIKGATLRIVPFSGNETLAKATKDYVTTIFRKSESEFYLGTMGAGLVKIDFKSGKFTLFNQDSGLPNNVIYGILEDNSKSIWISTNKGISKINLQFSQIKNFSEQNGLMSNEFNQGAYLKASNGDLFFGGIFGFNNFNPAKIYSIPNKLSVRFTQLKLDSNLVKPNDNYHILKRSLAYSNEIQLPYNKRSFSLQFIPNEIFQANLISYKYILEGADEEEVYLGSTNVIHFNSLQSGDYILKVYARKLGGEWCSEPSVLYISIATPYWKSVLFWVLVSLFVGLISFFVIRRRIDNERRQQVKLEMKIAERTREIREQNLQIEKQKQMIEEKKNSLEEQKRLLENEKEKTESLLKNIIPESTYEELKATGKSSAKVYDKVSVLFTDFVGFSKISERITPNELVSELDIYFRKFDEIIVRNNLEKIKTIGDAYMCAGGVPVPNKTNPIDACLAALQIQDTMRKLQVEAKKDGRIVWELRLGINTGEVTAGVIGVEKLAYDIWGSTVNKAQRMEMLGEPGKVTVSGYTFKHIEPYFNCSFKGKVKSKSKELIDMYTVDSIKAELSVNGEGIFPNESFNKIVNLHYYSQINYYKAERHIINVLEKKLSPMLHYHSINHTKDVCRASERLAILEGLTDEGLFLLKTAATYHDAGFVEKYDKNESIGARMAEEILPQYGYSAEHISQIKRLIYVTEVPHQPQSKIEEIICDADLDYLGRDDFHEIADLLRRELREHGKISSDRTWDEIQVKFLMQHRYFTDTAKRTRDEKKAKNLEEIRARLVENAYAD